MSSFFLDVFLNKYHKSLNYKQWSFELVPTHYPPKIPPFHKPHLVSLNNFDKSMIQNNP